MNEVERMNEDVLLDRYNPNKKKIEVYVDKEVKAKLKQGAKKRGLLFGKYIARILTNAARLQDGVKNED